MLPSGCDASEWVLRHGGWSVFGVTVPRLRSLWSRGERALVVPRGEALPLPRRQVCSALLPEPLPRAPQPRRVWWSLSAHSCFSQVSLAERHRGAWTWWRWGGKRFSPAPLLLPMPSSHKWRVVCGGWLPKVRMFYLEFLGAAGKSRGGENSCSRLWLRKQCLLLAVWRGSSSAEGDPGKQVDPESLAASALPSPGPILCWRGVETWTSWDWKWWCSVLNFWNFRWFRLVFAQPVCGALGVWKSQLCCVATASCFAFLCHVLFWTREQGRVMVRKVWWCECGYAFHKHCTPPSVCYRACTSCMWLLACSYMFGLGRWGRSRVGQPFLHPDSCETCLCWNRMRKSGHSVADQ